MEQPEKQGEQSITAESREAIYEVFKKFDKDNSGSIDYNEIGALAKQLGVEINQTEVIEIFKDLDVNKDQLIDFKEFWAWWSNGRPNKLEKLVYFKLRSMKLLQKAHADFKRLGGSLDSKYDNTVETHYAAVNYGEDPGKFRINVQVHCATEEIDKITQDFGFAKGTNAIVLDVKCVEGKAQQVSEAMMKWTEDLKKFTTLIGLRFDKFFSDILFTAEAKTPTLSRLTIKLSEALTEKLNAYRGLTMAQGVLDLIIGSFSASVGIRSSLKEITQQPKQIFVKWLLEGFLAEAKLTMNKKALQTVRQLFMEQRLTRLADIYDPDSSSARRRALKVALACFTTLVTASKFHLVFKDIQDIEELFRGLGLDEIAKDQPTNGDLIDELNKTFNEMFSNGGAFPINEFIKNFFDEVVDIVDSDWQLSVVREKQVLRIDVHAPFAGEIWKRITKPLASAPQE